MTAAELARIRNHPAFQELERRRNSFSWTLFGIMLAIYGGFMVLVAFDHSIVAQPIGGGPFTLAFPLGLGVIVASIALTAVYVVRANTEFDRLTREVVGAAEPAGAKSSGPLLGAVR